MRNVGLKTCLGKSEMPDDFNKTQSWLIFPKHRRVLWTPELFEEKVSKEFLYFIDYAKYSGNVDNEPKEEEK